MSPKYLNKLEGQLIVVIGGTSGIGFAVAEASIEHGANVVVASRSQAKIDEAVQKLKESYPDAADRVRGHPCSLGGDDVEAQITNLFEFATKQQEHKIDHIIDTAGEAPTSATTLESSTIDSWLGGYKERFVGSALIAKHALAYLRHQSSSSFTMTSGVLVHRPMKGMSTRVSAGGAKAVLTRALAVDMAPIRVNLVTPGAINTFALQKMMKAMGGAAAEERFKSSSLLNEIGAPEDIAESYLSSMKNHFLTGTELICDGGFLIK